MSRRVMVAVAVAVVLGIGTGAFAEHTRLKNGGSKRAAPAATTPTGWFANPSAACPGLQRWRAAAVAAYVALVRKGDWDATRKKLTPLVPFAQDALRSLIPLATPAGKPELQYLVTFHDRLVIAVEDAHSANAVFDSLDQLKTAEFIRDIAAVTQVASTCSNT